MDCIFCKIINNELPSYTIYEDDLVKVLLDINPSTNGDSLIIPKKHLENIFDIDDELLLHINKVAKEMFKLYQNRLNIDGLTLVQNNGLGQDIKHYHLHLTPRYKNDNLSHIFNKEILKSFEEIMALLKN